MEELIYELKNAIIEALNLEEVKPEEIDTTLRCSATVWDWIRSTPWS